jgi:mono/diheme cytochrome c family protein
MTRWDRSLAGAAVVWVGLVASSFGAATPPAQASQTSASGPQRLAEMRHHFSDVILVHEAVIRGDLRSVGPPAQALASIATPAGMPAATAPFVAEIRRAGQRAADAANLAAAAQATVSMVTACAGCHRAAGVMPAASRSIGHDVGGIVGHMLEHQRAADMLLIALMMPSATEWRQGADSLRVAALLPFKFPSDPKLTKDIRALDLRVHQIADRAIDAETADERARVYTDLLTTCAQCHFRSARR